MHTSAKLQKRPSFSHPPAVARLRCWYIDLYFEIDCLLTAYAVGHVSGMLRCKQFPRRSGSFLTFLQTKARTWLQMPQVVVSRPVEVTSAICFTQARQALQCTPWGWCTPT